MNSIKIYFSLLVLPVLSINSFSQNNMIDIKINQDAEAYILKNKIEVLSIYVDIIPCGCARPSEVPVIDLGAPENVQDFHMQTLNKLVVYTSKNMKVPNKAIEITILQDYGGVSKLHPAGIEYFIKGVGDFCKLPSDENKNLDN